jgi:hypothetical protein
MAERFAVRAGAFEGEALDEPDRCQSREARRHAIADRERFDRPVAGGGADAKRASRGFAAMRSKPKTPGQVAGPSRL